MSRSWVTTTIVTPCSRFRRTRVSMISCEVRVSRLPVGSSASSTLGWLMSARAIATRCCWPPDNWAGVLASHADRPSSASAARARRSRSGARWAASGA